MVSWMLQFLWHRCHRNPFSVYTRDISHAPVYTRNVLAKYRSAPGQGDCHSTWPWVHLTVRMLHDIYDMDVIISHPCHRYFFNKYGKLREKAGSTCNTVAVLPVASMSWLWHPRQCHSRLSSMLPKHGALEILEPLETLAKQAARSAASV